MCDNNHRIVRIECTSVSKISAYIKQQMIQRLLENGSNINIKDNRGLTPLHIVLENQDCLALEVFIRFGVNVNEPVGLKGESMFYFVVMKKFEKLVDLCFKFGADSYKKLYEKELYHTVIKMDDPSLTKLFWIYNHVFDDHPVKITKKSSPQLFPAVKCQTDFFKGISINDVDMVREALESGAEVNCCSMEMKYPLHYSAAHGLAQVVRLLLEYGKPACSLDSDGHTALELAAAADHVDTCAALMRGGACISFKTEQKYLPLIIKKARWHFTLLKKKNSKLLKQLTKYKLNENKEMKDELFCYINCVNKSGNTLLGEALGCGRTDISQMIMGFRNKDSLQVQKKKTGPLVFS